MKCKHIRPIVGMGEQFIGQISPVPTTLFKCNRLMKDDRNKTNHQTLFEAGLIGSEYANDCVLAMRSHTQKDFKQEEWNRCPLFEEKIKQS